MRIFWRKTVQIASASGDPPQTPTVFLSLLTQGARYLSYSTGWGFGGGSSSRRRPLGSGGEAPSCRRL